MDLNLGPSGRPKNRPFKLIQNYIWTLLCFSFKGKVLQGFKMPSRAPQRRRNLASHLRWLRSELAKTVLKYALTSSGVRVGMFARACSTSCDRDGAKPCSTFCLCSQANNMCSTMNRVPATRSCQLHSSCGFVSNMTMSSKGARI